MGYRTYIGYIPKEEYKKIKNMTKDKLFKYKKVKKWDDYLGPYAVCKNLYEFGKYTEFDDKKYYKPIFKNKKLQKYFEVDHDFYIVNKDFLEHIINHYTEKVKNIYKDMLNPFKLEIYKSKSKFLNFDFSKITKDEQTSLFKIIEHVREMAQEFGIETFAKNMLPYDLKKGNEITTSWKYEYSLFELVRIYKHFDWKNNIMIYYGY